MTDEKYTISLVKSRCILGGNFMSLGRVLVVDDDKNICELLRLYLEKEGYGVILAHDGEEAVAIVGGIIVVIAIVIIYTPPVQTTIHNISNSITELAIDLFSEAKDAAISIQEASKKGTGKKQTKKSERKNQAISQAG